MNIFRVEFLVHEQNVLIEELKSRKHRVCFQEENKSFDVTLICILLLSKVSGFLFANFVFMLMIGALFCEQTRIY